MTPYEVKKNKEKVDFRPVKVQFEVRAQQNQTKPKTGGCGCGGGK